MTPETGVLLLAPQGTNMLDYHITIGIRNDTAEFGEQRNLKG